MIAQMLTINNYLLREILQLLKMMKKKEKQPIIKITEMIKVMIQIMNKLWHKKILL